MSPFRLYTAFCLVAAAIAVTAVAGAAIAVDPYALWTGERIEGFNAKKPKVYTHGQLAKLALARRTAPQTVILGNSRVDVGIDPDSAVWPSIARPVFNLGIPGQGIDGDLKNLNTLFQRGEAPRVVLMGVEFLDFTFDPSAQKGPTPRPNESGLLDKLMVFARTSLSITALVDTAQTLRAQGDQYSVDMTSRGLNPMHQYTEFVRLEGHYAIFRQRNVEYARAQLRGGKEVVAPGGQKSPAFDELQSIIDWCRARNTTLHLVIYPYHADLLEMFHATGLWPAFEKWKKILVDTVALNQRNGGHNAVFLWDFSGYSEFTTEAVPPPDDRKTKMRWYWESGHFKAALGERILHRIFGEPVAEFGLLLSPENIDAHISAIRNQASNYRITRTADVTRINQIYAQVAADRQRARKAHR